MPKSDCPNVIVLLSTQWRASALSCAGDPNARTPCLDALAREGVRFTQAVTPHPFGVFARAAFLIGRRCPANGVKEYFDPLPREARTLAHAFSDNGYETAFFGKWQLYERDPKAPVVGEAHARIVVPEDRRGGFDFWEGFESGFLLNDPLLHGTNIAVPTRFEGYQSDVICERFVRYAESRPADSPPLFSILSIDPPHPPYAAPASGVQAVGSEEVRLIEGTSGDPEIRAKAASELAGYYAHIEASDRAIGRLIRRLKESGAWENTVFAFSSAHGDMHGVEGKFRKGWPHEESVRIPLVLSWPGRLPAGGDSDLLISLLDFGPTLLGLAAGLSAERMAQNAFHGQDLSRCILEAAPGPLQQAISMPSVAPFALQCPYVWSASRTAERTLVVPEEGDRFVLEHAKSKRFG